MTAGKGNLPASVAARLLNRAKQTGAIQHLYRRRHDHVRLIR